MNQLPGKIYIAALTLWRDLLSKGRLWVVGRVANSTIARRHRQHARRARYPEKITLGKELGSRAFIRLSLSP
jgi:hypothetical protein